MCVVPKIKSAALPVLDPNAGKAAAESEMRARRGQSGFAANLKTTGGSAGSAASKILFGQ